MPDFLPWQKPSSASCIDPVKYAMKVPQGITFQATPGYERHRTMTPALGLTVYQPDKAHHGYTLFAPMTGTSAYLIDMQGRIVYHWALPYRPAQVQGVVVVCEDFLRRQVAGLCRPGDIRYDATSRPTCRKGASWR